MSESTSHYVHGTDPEEQRRLSLLNDILNAGSLRELGLSGGESVLDLGCGLGQLTRLMAGAAGPAGRVLGIDRSPEQLAEARRPEAGGARAAAPIELREGDVLDLRLAVHEWGAFDVAHTRFLLEHLPDPLAVVRSMVRAVRPGGRVVLEDEDHEIMRPWPAPEGFGEVWGAYIDSYRRAGNDPSIGKRLVELLHRAGARPRRSTFIYFGACSGDPLFPAVATNLIGVLRGAKPAVLAGGSVSEASFELCLAAIREWGERPDAALWYAMAWAEGVKPEG
jgi:SAM-dependent methyltransferase